MSGLREAIAANGAGDELEADVELEEGATSVAPDSVLAQVRARAAQIRTETTVDIPIPGYDERFIGRYRAVSLTRFNRVAGGELHVPLLDWSSAADALASALEGLYAVNAAGKLVPLYSTGEAARYDGELATRLELPVSERSARAVMVAVFGGGGKGESRISQHFQAYHTWLTEGAASEVAEAVVGETRG